MSCLTFTCHPLIRVSESSINGLNDPCIGPGLSAKSRVSGWVRLGLDDGEDVAGFVLAVEGDFAECFVSAGG